MHFWRRIARKSGRAEFRNDIGGECMGAEKRITEVIKKNRF
jgi:hypothetical protein